MEPAGTDNHFYRTFILRRSSVYGIALLFAFGVISLFTALVGYNILKVLRTLVFSSFRSLSGFEATVRVAIPLIFTTYAFAIPFKIKFFNTGGWGQMLFGGAMTAVVGLAIAGSGMPSYAMIPTLLIAGILSGGSFALIAGYLKADYDINPIVSTIMLNYVGLQFVSFICTTPRFLDPRGGHPQTLLLAENSILGFMNGIPYSIIVAALAVIFVFFLLNKTKLGYEITAVGYNMIAAQAYGINFRYTIMITFFIGGALAGLGGSLEVINIHGRLLVGFAHTSGANYGALGVLTALVVAGNPLGIPFSAFFMSVLLVGADRLQRTMQVPVELVFLFQAIIVLFIVVIRAKFAGGNK